MRSVSTSIKDRSGSNPCQEFDPHERDGIRCELTRHRITSFQLLMTVQMCRLAQAIASRHFGRSNKEKSCHLPI
jgi:hypothetical protein